MIPKFWALQELFSGQLCVPPPPPATGIAHLDASGPDVLSTGVAPPAQLYEPDDVPIVAPVTEAVKSAWPLTPESPIWPFVAAK